MAWTDISSVEASERLSGTSVETSERFSGTSIGGDFWNDSSVGHTAEKGFIWVDRPFLEKGQSALKQDVPGVFCGGL